MRVVARAWKRRRGEGEAGFTLLEVLVALTVLSLSLAVLLAIFTQGLDRTREDEARLNARILAQSLLQRAEVASPASLNTVSGEDGQYLWQVLVTPYGGSDDRQAWAAAAANIAVQVSWQDHGRTRTVSLSTLRLLPKESSS